MQFSVQEMEQNLVKSHIWVFGYGSLIWKPNFVYEERVIGYIEGYERRFWQGSIVDRGSSERPGRVATLVESKNSRVWGVSYKVQGAQNIRKALAHLKIREQHYETRILEFHAKNWPKSVFALVFYATPANNLYLGQASDSQICLDIFSGYGVSGSNIEYLFRVADFMRSELSDIKDEHLFEIEKLVRNKLGLSSRNIASWIELVKSRSFFDVLSKLGRENCENLLTM